MCDPDDLSLQLRLTSGNRDAMGITHGLDQLASIDFRRKTGKRICLSFVGSQLFVAIPYRHSLFEPKIFSKITDFQSVREYFEDLQIFIGIVEDLSLNTRIWTKRGTEEILYQIP